MVGGCHRIIKHRFGMMMKTATRHHIRGLWVRSCRHFAELCKYPEEGRQRMQSEEEMWEERNRESREGNSANKNKIQTIKEGNMRKIIRTHKC